MAAPQNVIYMKLPYDPAIALPGIRSREIKTYVQDFPGGAVVKNPPANAGDMGSSPGREDPTHCGATKPVGHSY